MTSVRQKTIRLTGCKLKVVLERHLMEKVQFLGSREHHVFLKCVHKYDTDD